jgi:hypothetical protein
LTLPKGASVEVVDTHRGDIHLLLGARTNIPELDRIAERADPRELHLGAPLFALAQSSEQAATRGSDRPTSYSRFPANAGAGQVDERALASSIFVRDGRVGVIRDQSTNRHRSSQQ